MRRPDLGSSPPPPQSPPPPPLLSHASISHSVNFPERELLSRMSKSRSRTAAPRRQPKLGSITAWHQRNTRLISATTSAGTFSVIPDAIRLSSPGAPSSSTQAYEQAVAAAESLEADQVTESTTAKILSRTLLLQRASRAANACSTLLQRKVRQVLTLSVWNDLT